MVVPSVPTLLAVGDVVTLSVYVAVSGVSVTSSLSNHTLLALAYLGPAA